MDTMVTIPTISNKQNFTFTVTPWIFMNSSTNRYQQIHWSYLLFKPETATRKNWYKQKMVTFTHFSPLIRRITNLFKQTNLKVTFRATNTIQQLTKKQTHKDPSGIYKLKCNTCNRAYVGQSGRAIRVRYGEHIRYIRTNNPKSAYATHILDNRHEYGTSEDTLQFLQACQKGTRMDCGEALYIQLLHQQNVWSMSNRQMILTPSSRWQSQTWNSI
jgi:hypothetical protein